MLLSLSNFGPIASALIYFNFGRYLGNYSNYLILGLCFISLTSCLLLISTTITDNLVILFSFTKLSTVLSLNLDIALANLSQVVLTVIFLCIFSLNNCLFWGKISKKKATFFNHKLFANLPLVLGMIILLLFSTDTLFNFDYLYLSSTSMWSTSVFSVKKKTGPESLSQAAQSSTDSPSVIGATVFGNMPKHGLPYNVENIDRSRTRWFSLEYVMSYWHKKNENKVTFHAEHPLSDFLRNLGITISVSHGVLEGFNRLPLQSMGIKVPGIKPSVRIGTTSSVLAIGLVRWWLNGRVNSFDLPAPRRFNEPLPSEPTTGSNPDLRTWTHEEVIRVPDGKTSYGVQPGNSPVQTVNDSSELILSDLKQSNVAGDFFSFVLDWLKSQFEATFGSFNTALHPFNYDLFPLVMLNKMISSHNLFILITCLLATSLFFFYIALGLLSYSEQYKGFIVKKLKPYTESENQKLAYVSNKLILFAERAAVTSKISAVVIYIYLGINLLLLIFVSFYAFFNPLPIVHSVK